MDDFAPNLSEAMHPLLRTPESVPLALAAIDSFYVGGERCPFVNAAGDQDEQIVGAMYVQHMVPAERRFPIPVVFIHGGCHTGVTWETTPDGREGWALLFVRGGFETYVIDQAWRGRSAPVLAGGENAPPVTWSAGLSAIPFFTRQGGRFPDVSAEAYAAQFWPDFGILQAVRRGHPGYCDPRALPPLLALLDRIGPAVLVTHSQGGDLGWQAAIHRPARVAAIYAIEPGITRAGLGQPDFPHIPVRILWGDNLPDDGFALKQSDVAEAQELARLRRNVSVDWLPEHGICGNGHMLMMENNSSELAQRAMAWLHEAVSDRVGPAG